MNFGLFLRGNRRKTIQVKLMWIDLEEEESRPISHKFNNSDGIWSNKNRIVIPVFDLYIKEMRNKNETDSLPTYIYEIRITTNDIYMLKNLQCKLFYEGKPNFRNIVIKQRTMTNVILRHNTFLQKITTVQISRIKKR